MCLIRTRARTLGLATLVLAVGMIASLPGTAFAQSTVVQWAGILDFINEDSTTGALTGGVPGASNFDGYFSFPTICGAGCVVEPFPPDATNYVFVNGAGLIRGLGTSVRGVESSIEIIDEQILDADGVALAAFYGITATVGQTIDAWALSSENDAEFTPAFVDWNITYLYITSDPFTSTAFVAAPPPSPDLIIFEVYEGDGSVYEGVGRADVLPVPEPGFGPLLAVGALGLVFGGRRRVLLREARR